MSFIPYTARSHVLHQYGPATTAQLHFYTLLAYSMVQFDGLSISSLHTKCATLTVPSHAHAYSTVPLSGVRHSIYPLWTLYDMSGESHTASVSYCDSHFIASKPLLW